MGVCFFEVTNFEHQTCEVGQKGTKVLQTNKGFNFLNISRKVSAVKIIAELLKYNSTVYNFLDIFQSFWCSYFKTLLLKHV